MHSPVVVDVILVGSKLGLSNVALVTMVRPRDNLQAIHLILLEIDVLRRNLGCHGPRLEVPYLLSVVETPT